MFNAWDSHSLITLTDLLKNQLVKNHDLLLPRSLMQICEVYTNKYLHYDDEPAHKMHTSFYIVP